MTQSATNDCDTIEWGAGWVTADIACSPQRIRIKFSRPPGLDHGDYQKMGVVVLRPRRNLRQAHVLQIVGVVWSTLMVGE